MCTASIARFWRPLPQIALVLALVILAPSCLDGLDNAAPYTSWLMPVPRMTINLRFQAMADLLILSIDFLALRARRLLSPHAGRLLVDAKKPRMRSDVHLVMDEPLSRSLRSFLAADGEDAMPLVLLGLSLCPAA